MQSDLLRAGVRVLLVDDDELIRECLAELLTDAGWRVSAAASAEEALRIADADGPQDILVADLLLGRGMNGVALVAAARHRWPHVRAVLISGADVADPMLDPGDRYLRKPFSSKTLIQLVAELAWPEVHATVMQPFVTAHRSMNGVVAR